MTKFRMEKNGEYYRITQSKNGRKWRVLPGMPKWITKDFAEAVKVLRTEQIFERLRAEKDAARKGDWWPMEEDDL